MKKIDSEKYLKENKFRIKSNRVNMVSNKMINEMTDEDFTDAFIQNRNYYCLSNPVFNQTEDIAIIKYKIVFKNTDIFLYNLNFYKKINGKWIKICAVVPTRE